MHTTRTRIIVTIVILFVAIQSFAFIIWTEKQKKLQKIESDNAYYQSLNNEYNQYLNDYNGQIAKIREENISRMKAAEAQYNELLNQQQSIIAQHTKAVAQGNTSNTFSNTTVATVKSNQQSSTSKVVVSKPASTPKTRTS